MSYKDTKQIIRLYTTSQNLCWQNNPTMQVIIIDSSQNQLNHKEKDKEPNIKKISNYIFLSVLQLKCTNICPSPNKIQVLHKSTCPSLYLTTKLASQATCVSFTPWHLGRLHKSKFDNYNYNTTQPHFTLKIYKCH